MKQNAGSHVEVVMMRWLLAVLGWLGPNVLLFLALASIPKTESHDPAGGLADYVASAVVFPVFFGLFFAVGMLSMRLALHAAPESGRAGVSKAGFWGSLAFLALCLAVVASEATAQQELGFACFLLWGIGHLLGSRWKTRPADRA